MGGEPGIFGQQSGQTNEIGDNPLGLIGHRLLCLAVPGRDHAVFHQQTGTMTAVIGRHAGIDNHHLAAEAWRDDIEIRSVPQHHTARSIVGQHCLKRRALNQFVAAGKPAIPQGAKVCSA